MIVIARKIAEELKLRSEQVAAAIQLLDEGSTVPFIARYRKEATGELTDTHLRDLEERLSYLRELEARRVTILDSIQAQGKLTEELKAAIEGAEEKARLEDLYAPYKPKRRSKAQIAKEAGLEPLAEAILADQQAEPQDLAMAYLNPAQQIPDVAAALEGARQILMEKFSEAADLVAELREYSWQQGILHAVVIKDRESEGAKFSDYFDYQEAIHKIPSHRALAVFRGQKEEFLRLSLAFADPAQEADCIAKIAASFDLAAKNSWLQETAAWTWKIKLKLKIDLDLMTRLREASELEAIKVFQDNLRNLLMAAPAGQKITMGLDPGLRTGVKVVVVDDTGKLLAYQAIFPHAPRHDWEGAIAILAKLCEHFKVNLLSIGNGTASRETDRLAAELMKRHPHLPLTKVVVSEAGASVYSASALAAEEFPDLDVSYRGAVSIARRLQDPLAELVKIDPKSIGVGQYQHDVNQVKLGLSLSAVLEDCVNAVGADVNTASVPLLKSIAGLNETLAQNIVHYRQMNGRFKNREALRKVPRLGEKTYEQAIGFLRIIGGDSPLDASAVHPEAYPLVENILQKSGKSLTELMGNLSALRACRPEEYVTEQFGLPTVQDILAELQKPGRDPRPEFVMARFKEGVEELKDLKPEMLLEGVVTNVTNFGAFVDIGVHQDGLVHISQLSDRFVSDAHEVVKVGQIVKVKVVELDLARQRIQLSMKLGAGSGVKVPLRKPETPKTAFGTALLGALGK